jgi:hypothetical protein
MSFLTRLFLIAATLLGGLLAGMALDKTLVQLPTWRELGAQSWLGFMRRADLGRGLVLYPAQGIVALLCSVFAATTYYLDGAASRAAAIPVYTAAVLAIMALVITRFFVTPEILRLRGTVDDPAVATHILNSTAKWWVS